ncbi:hypothetical protein ACFSAG_10440 [Sphingorhabdus buctiana]|jgi:hypothetical protein|uniref:Uncharacterized protein n=1 Tax=Sphingorhabdus buctiana TaxID=1508805 RepID=A0ABW4MFY9_9SPHN
MKKAIFGMAVLLTAVVAQPALARDHRGDRHSEYRERHHEDNRGGYRDQGYRYDGHSDRRYARNYEGYYEPRRDRHFDRGNYYYDRHGRKAERRHHRRNHH